MTWIGIDPLLKDDRWLANAGTANAGAQLLGKAAGDRLAQPVEVNEVFVALSAEESAAFFTGNGVQFYDWEAGLVRFVVSWDQPDGDIGALASALHRIR